MAQDLELIEPMSIEIEQKDVDNTPFPSGISGRKFPVNHKAWKAPFRINAQVAFGERDMKGNHTQLGTGEIVKGYIIVLYKDLLADSIDLKRGDRITKLITKQEELDVELYFVTSLGDPSAHVDGQFGLKRIMFEDREPVGG